VRVPARPWPSCRRSERTPAPAPRFWKAGTSIIVQREHFLMCSATEGANAMPSRSKKPRSRLVGVAPEACQVLMRRKTLCVIDGSWLQQF
jgi:hypothetical protein